MKHLNHNVSIFKKKKEEKKKKVTSFHSLIFLMYMIHLSSILVYLCIDITQINFHQFFQHILLNMFNHTSTQQEMLKITVLIKQRKCFLIVQLEIVDLLFGILLDKTVKHCKTNKHFRN